MALSKQIGALKDKPWLPIILWLAPVFVLNFGFEFISHINFSWAENSQREYAQNEAEALAASADYSYQLAKTAARFKRAFVNEEASPLPNDSLTKRLQKHEKNIFKKPFPAYSLFAFKLPKGANKASLLIEHTNAKNYSRLALTKTFELLCSLKDTPSDSAKQTDIKWFKAILGKHTLPKVIKDKKGQSTLVIWQKKPAWFVCDFFTGKTNDTLGYFIITPNLITCADDGRRLALADYEAKPENKKSFAAFINVFDKNALNFASKPLAKSKIFKRFADKLVFNTDQKRYNYLKTEPLRQQKLGNYNAYAFLAKSQTHMALCLFKRLKKTPKPWYITLLTVSAVYLIIIAMLKGVLLAQWPRWGLKLRFLMIYFLLSTLPIAMFAVCAAGYLIRYQKASYFETIASLKNACRQFDTSKQLIANDYQSAFNKALNSKKLQQLLKQPKSKERNEKITSLLFDFYKKREIPLPIMALAVIDAQNNVIFKTEGPKQEATDAVKSFSCFLAELLAQEIKDKTGEITPEIKKTDDQKAFLATYQVVGGRDLYYDLNKRRSFMVKIEAGTKTLVRMHDTIKIDNKPAYMLMAVCNPNSLDDITYNLTLSSLSLTKPSLSFFGCRMTPEAEPLAVNKNKRLHLSRDFLSNALGLAKQAYFRNGTAQQDTKNYYMLAMKAQKYTDTVFVAGQNKIGLQLELFKRCVIFLVILCFTLLITAACSLYSSELILRPITTLKAALEKVARGSLLTEISSSRSDEIGALGIEFSSMIKGLRERQRLSSLISDQAIYAITTAESSKALRETSFSAVFLSADIRNFTSLSESHKPEQITDMLNRHFDAMSVAVAQYGGQIYKFVGDEIEAVFEESAGYNESASVRAFYASLLMLNKLKSINEVRKQKKQFQYKMGIGLCFGGLNAGAVGSGDTRLDYSIIGKPVKEAAKLEGLSKTLSETPIVFNYKIAKDLNAAKIQTEALKNQLDAYTVCQNQGLCDINARKAALKTTDYDSAENINEKSVYISLDAEKKPRAAFLTAILAAAAGLFAAFYFDDFYYNSRLKREEAAAEESNRRLLDQVGSGSAARLAFETNCRRLVKKLETLPITNKEFIKTKLPKLLKAKVGNPLKHEYLCPSLAYFSLEDSDKFVFDPNLNNDNGTFKRIICEGLEDKDAETLKKSLCFFAAKALSNNAVCNKNAIDAAKFQQIFGNTHTPENFAAERMARSVDARFDDKEAFVFCSVVASASESARVGLFSSDNAAKLAGVLLAVAPSKELKENSSFFYVLNAFETPNQHLCKITDKGIAYSALCPTGLYSSIKDKSKAFKNNYYISYAETEQGSLAAIKKLNTKKLFNSPKYIAVMLFCAALFLALAWAAAYKNTVISRFLALKLWLILLLSSAIPLAAVFVFFQFFIDEDCSVKLSNATNELNTFINDFELKQYYLEPVLYKELKKLTQNANTQGFMKKIIKQSESEHKISPHNENKLKQWLNCCTNKLDDKENDIYRFHLKSASIGLKYGSAAIGGDLKDILTALSQEAAERYLGRNAEFNDKTSREKLKNEEAFNAFVSALRGAIGDEFYTKALSAYEIPVTIRVVADEGVFMVFLGPNELKPEYVCIWLATMNYSSYLSQVAADLYEGKYEAMAINLIKYGQAGTYKHGLGRHYMAETAGLICSANLPLVRQIRHNKSNYLLAGRLGTLQTSSVIAAAVALDDIEKTLFNYKYAFYLMVFAVIALILCTAKAAADDILAPIKSLILGIQYVEREQYGYRIEVSRNDELGGVCASFNTMMRSLEEKLVMGKMLSKSAVESASEQRSKSASHNYICMFVGICGFISHIENKTASEIFADLKGHIERAAKAIINQGGDIDKIIGEKILAVFKADVNPVKAAKCALNAAEEILRLEKQLNTPYSAAIGINYGKIIGGFLGIGKKRDFTVIGDAVNVAARLEALAEKPNCDKLVLSESAARLAEKSGIKTELLSEVELKGKAKALKVYTKKA